MNDRAGQGPGARAGPQAACGAQPREQQRTQKQAQRVASTERARTWRSAPLQRSGPGRARARSPRKAMNSGSAEHERQHTGAAVLPRDPARAERPHLPQAGLTRGCPGGNAAAPGGRKAAAGRPRGDAARDERRREPAGARQRRSRWGARVFCRSGQRCWTLCRSFRPSRSFPLSCPTPRRRPMWRHGCRGAAPDAATPRPGAAGCRPRPTPWAFASPPLRRHAIGEGRAMTRVKVLP